MEEADENRAGITENFKGGDFSIHIKCPKCRGEDVLIEEDEEGYFQVLRCNKCGYVRR